MFIPLPQNFSGRKQTLSHIIILAQNKYYLTTLELITRICSCTIFVVVAQYMEKIIIYQCL